MLYPLFETLCYENGHIANLAFHQIRYEKSLYTFYGQRNAPILADIFPHFLAFQTLPKHGLFRLRLAYNAHHFQLEIFPYQRKTYRHFKPVVCNHIDYALKYCDRTLLSQLFAQKDRADEILIIKNGRITDCSIGNVVLRQNGHWFTPTTPLLQGTQRAYLLSQGKITATEILLEDLPMFDEIRLINALNPL